MQSLMEYGTVADLLELDARDEKRNRMLLGAVTEAVCLYLDRNLILSTTTESLIPYDGINITPEEYPVRRIETIIEEGTGTLINLAPYVKLRDISRPDAHRQYTLQLERPCAGRALITYQHGYEPQEMPQLIQATILEMMSDRIIMFRKEPDYDIKGMDKDRFMNIAPYRRMFYR